MGKDSIIFKVDPETKKWYQENSSKSLSAKIRHIVEDWKEVEEQEGIREDLANVQFTMLKSYRNLVDKQIQALKRERDKIEEKIESHEKEGEEDVILTVEMDYEEEEL
jgi:protein subunit release factor B